MKGYFDGLSVRCNYIRMYVGETLLAHATCFFVTTAEGPVLVTNRHNFTGRNNITDKPLHKECGIPNHAVVTLHTGRPGEEHYHIDLVDHEDPDAPAWIEHPTLGSAADVVALPVKELGSIVNDHTSVTLDGDWLRWDVGGELQVIGYPYGRIGGPFPVWSKGFIASEPDVDIAELPVFLIDCRSRPGQSGSPVFVRIRPGETIEERGEIYAAKVRLSHFLGAYSGRLRPDSDLGFVWKRSCIAELVDHAIAVGRQHRTDRRRHRFTAGRSREYTLDQVIADVDELA